MHLLAAFSKRHVIKCANCEAPLVVAFNERMVLAAILWGGIGWFIGFVAAYGSGYHPQAASVATVVGISMGAVASYRHAFRLSEAN